MQQQSNSNFLTFNFTPISGSQRLFINAVTFSKYGECFLNSLKIYMLSHRHFRGTAGFFIFSQQLLTLGQLRVSNCPTGLEKLVLQGQSSPQARNRRKATAKILRNPLRHKTDYIPMLSASCCCASYGNNYELNDI